MSGDYADPRTVTSGEWKVSSFCSSGTCVQVQVSRDSGVIRVRNSQKPEAAITFDTDEWAAFVAGVRNAEFDV